MERFDALRKAGFKADEEFKRVASDCFPEGMEATMVQKLLDTAEKSDRGHGQSAFLWEVDMDGSTQYYCVITVGHPGYPPKILKTDWRIVPGT
jgi:hypothetical protein